MARLEKKIQIKKRKEKKQSEVVGKKEQIVKVWNEKSRDESVSGRDIKSMQRIAVS